MGYYIWNKDEMDEKHGGNHLDKATRLLATHPEITELEKPVFDLSGRTVLVCVVPLPTYDAAVICYSKAELKDWNRPVNKKATRKRRWLVLPRALALELCPAVSGLLPREQPCSGQSENQPSC